jgi:hypothetical protein
MSIYGGCEGHQRVYRNDSTGGFSGVWRLVAPSPISKLLARTE